MFLADHTVACAREGHAEFRVVKKGQRAGAQRFACVAPDGSTHMFAVPLDEPATRDRRRKHTVSCPTPSHADGRVRYKGKRTNAKGLWHRYVCVRPNGSQHGFSLLVAASGSVIPSVAPPPECPEHEGSSVVRNGSFGKGAKRRQRYRCVPDDPKLTHYFTPPLSRETVDLGEDACATCDEMLSPHRGPLTAARHTPWTMKTIVQALNDLSLGASYASVSMAMRASRDTVAEHLASAHGIELAAPAGSPEARSGSWTRREGQTAWHLAADLVEQYAPLLFGEVSKRLVAREQRLRAANDEKLAVDPDAPLAEPLVYMLDELPVSFRRRTQGGRLQQSSWSLLVVAEIRWRPAPDPMSWPRREARLRLVRAYPRANADAWRLVLAELPVRPDFIVADCADAITNAVTQHYGANAVGLIPSLFHVHRNVRAALMQLAGTTATVGDRKSLVGPLAKHLDLLTRDELLGFEADRWKVWWDELVDLVAQLPAPTSGVVAQRGEYEGRIAAALPLLRSHPHLPASNAAVEIQHRKALEPFLLNRRHLYRNLARTNFLCDLAVCRSQGAFTDLDAVARKIRKANEGARGWAPAPRQLADAQPKVLTAAGKPVATYSSLLNPLLVAALAKQRLAGTATPQPSGSVPIPRSPSGSTPSKKLTGGAS